jgi:hypothetical protein
MTLIFPQFKKSKLFYFSELRDFNIFFHLQGGVGNDRWLAWISKQDTRYKILYFPNQGPWRA